jgi:hypothetical protein
MHDVPIPDDLTQFVDLALNAPDLLVSETLAFLDDDEREAFYDLLRDRAPGAESERIITATERAVENGILNNPEGEEARRLTDRLRELMPDDPDAPPGPPDGPDPDDPGPPQEPPPDESSDDEVEDGGGPER